MRLNRLAGWTLVGFTVLMVSACSGNGANVAPDPTSLAELDGLGGASWELMAREEIAAASGMALEVEVIDIHPSRFNTADGEFPSLREIETFGMKAWNVVTDIDARVLRVLSSAGPEPEAGERFTFAVTGGRFDVLLDLERATAIGFTGDDENLGEPLAEPVEATFGYSSGFDIAEGDRLVVFLHEFDVAGFGNAPNFVVWVPVHPDAVFYSSPDGGWFGDRSLTELVDVDALAQLIGPD